MGVVGATGAVGEEMIEVGWEGPQYAMIQLHDATGFSCGYIVIYIFYLFIYIFFNEVSFSHFVYFWRVVFTNQAVNWAYHPAGLLSGSGAPCASVSIVRATRLIQKIAILVEICQKMTQKIRFSGTRLPLLPPCNLGWLGQSKTRCKIQVAPPDPRDIVMLLLIFCSLRAISMLWTVPYTLVDPTW